MKQRHFILLLICIGLGVYLNSLFNGFVWDDEEQVLNNTAVHSIKNIFLFFQSSTFNSGGSTTLGGLYYKPLMTTAFSLLYSLFGPNAFFFHLFQLCLHIANSILVFLLFKTIFKRVEVKFSQTVSFFLALIFLIHPINTESVIYIADLQGILFFFFGMLALLLTVKNKIHSIKEKSFIGLLLTLSLLSKETGALIIPLILLYLFIFERPKIYSLVWPIISSISTYAILRFLVAGIYLNKHGLSPITTMPLLERMLSAPKIVFFYIKTFFFPQHLAISQHWVVKEINVQSFYFPLLTSLFLLALLIFFGIYIYKKNKTSGLIFLFFFVWLCMSLSFHLHIFPLDLTFSDRWFYLQMVGILGVFGIVVLTQKNLLENKITKTIVLTLLIIVISLLSIRTIVRNTDWRDGLSLYSHDAQISTESFDLENNLGVELFRTGKFKEAKIHFEKSIKLAPNWWTNWNNLGAIEEREGNTEKAEQLYRKAIENGQYYIAYENVANILLLQKKDPKKAKEFSEEALQLLPNNAKLWLILALSEHKLGNKERALIGARNAAFLNPNQLNMYVYSQLQKDLPLEIEY